MSTHTKNGLKENVIEIFGLSSFQSLIKFEQTQPDVEIMTEFKVVLPNKQQQEMDQSLDSEELEKIRKRMNIFNVEGKETHFLYNKNVVVTSSLVVVVAVV